MAAQEQTQRPAVVECPGVNSTAVVRAATISGSVSASIVVALFVLFGFLRHRRAAQLSTATPPPPPPPDTPLYAPPAYLYAPAMYPPDDLAALYAPTTAAQYALPTAALYAPTTAALYPPPTVSWPHVTVVSHHHDSGAGDVELAAATVGYATAAGTTAAAACAIM